jgi:hypothetical protein
MAIIQNTFGVLLLAGDLLQYHMRSTACLAYVACIIYYLQIIFVTTGTAAYSSLPWVRVHILFWCIAVDISYLLTMLNTLTVSMLAVVLSNFSHMALKFIQCSDRNNTASYKERCWTTAETSRNCQVIPFLLVECSSYQISSSKWNIYGKNIMWYSVSEWSIISKTVWWVLAPV